jgi:hypothetical protein
MSIHRHPPALCLLGLGVIAGCSATLPIDNSVVFPSMPVSEDGCLPAVDRIPSVDEPTPLGFTAIDVLTRLAGPRSSALDWLEPAPSAEYLLEYGPERGRSTLDLDVRVAEGPILYRYRVPALGASEETECGGGALEIPVEVTLRSGEQALDERFETTLEASVPYRGRLRKTLLTRSLDGGLTFDRVTSLDPDRSFVLETVTFDAVLWPGGSMGSLGTHVDARRARPPTKEEMFGPPPNPARQPRDVATWPSAHACPGGGRALPIDAPVLGFSAADVLERLARGGPRQLTRGDGTTTAVNVELAQVVDPELCQDVTDRLSFGVTLRAKSEDGSVDDVLLVQVEALDDGGDIGEISLASDAPSAFPEVEMPAAQLGAGADDESESPEPGDVTVVE